MTLHRNARTCPEPRRLSAPQFRLDPPMQSSASLKAAIQKALARPDTLHAMAITNLRTAQRDYRTASYKARLMRIIDSLPGRTPRQAAAPQRKADERDQGR